MGHLVNPVSFRLGISRYWNSRWVTQNLYKYNFMFKSDWNVYKFLVRLFSRDELVSLGLVFSHVIFVRTSTCFYSIIYFWDGKTLQNLNDNLKKLLFKFSRYKILTKFFVVMNFFLKYYRIQFFFKKYFCIYFWVLKKKFIFFKILFHFFILSFLKNFVLSSFFRKDNNLLIHVFFLILKKYLLKIFLKLKIKNIIKQLEYFFSFFNLYRIFLLKIQSFFSNFFNNFIFLDYVYRNLNFFFNKDRSSFLAIYSTLTHFVKKFVSNLFLQKSNFKILLRPMSKLDINSAFIARYLAIRMQQRYRLMQALSPVFSDLRRSPLVNGYRVACSGRFTKKEIATYEWFRFGGVPTNTLSAHLDYWSVPFILKYSMCSFKVWINKKQKDKNYNIEEFRNSFSDILIPYNVGSFINTRFAGLKDFVMKKRSDFFISKFKYNNRIFFLKNFLKFRISLSLINNSSCNSNFRKLSLFFTNLLKNDYKKKKTKGNKKKIGRTKSLAIKINKILKRKYIKKYNIKWFFSILFNKKKFRF